jgi:SAM-dependent methyltransferase
MAPKAPAGAVKFRDRPCPVCGARDGFTVFAPSNFDPAKLNAFSFSSRKLPEWMHHRMLHCLRCDVLYSSPVPELGSLAGAYQEAMFDSSEEAQYASRTYARQLEGVAFPDHVGALDIGTGDGAFLERLLEAGFSQVQGVEPSRAPIQAAKPGIRKLIRHGIFSASKYRAGSLSLVTCFQTLEHLAEPRQVCEASFRLLKPGGAFFTVCHSHRSLSAKILGLKSPIFDIEHMQLFSPASVRFMMEQAGFEGVRVYSISNSYPIHYWMKVFPFPKAIKAALIGMAKASGLGQVALPMPAGNLVAIGSKPRAKGAKPLPPSLDGAADRGLRISAKPPKALLLAMALAVLGFVADLALDNGRPWHHGPAQAAPKPVPLEAWGPELALAQLGSFPVAEDAWDLAADAQGDVYVLTENTIHCYHDGKKARSLFIGNTNARSMAFDGETFFITEVMNSGIDKVRKDFKDPTGFGAAGTYHLMGIGYSPAKKLLIASDIEGKNLVSFDAMGKPQDHVAGPLSLHDKDGNVMALGIDQAGGIVEIDRSSGQFSFFAPDYSLQKNMAVPWHNPNRERLVFMNGRFYINCFSDQCILIMDPDGTPVGRVKLPSPSMMGAGKDGYLYVESQGSILKLQPLPEAQPLGTKAGHP